MIDRRFTLPSGRGLAWAEFGAPAGVPVIYCHGFPGSRLEPAFAHRVASAMGARIIAIDRPGLGASQPCPGRSIAGWADDVRHLADHLRLDTLRVLGVSAGAPYALACAYRLAERTHSVAIVSGLGPAQCLGHAPAASACALTLRMSATLPWTAGVVAGVLGVMARHASPLLLRMLSARAPERDRQSLNDGEFRAMLAASLREAFRCGSGGAASDLRLLARPWGFALEELHRPIRLWHGEQDRTVPAAMGRCLQRALPACHATYLEAHGHYSLAHEHMEAILSRLID